MSLRATAAGTAAVGAGVAATAWAVTRAGQHRPRTYALDGQVVLVTGANSGIGKETAVALARGGARVLAAARDPERGRLAVDEIRRRTGSDDVELVDLDLASLASVRACADQIRARTDRLDVLVNNAGLVLGERQVTSDGFEATIAINHLGPFLLTNLLLPLLRASAPARVVTVSSLAHRNADLDLDDLMWERRRYQSMVVYGTSKLANILFTRELARRLAGTGVVANCLHPGTIRSGFGRDGEGHWLLELGVKVAAPFFVDAERGASTSVFLAGDPSVATVSGVYFSRSRPAPTSPAARDDLLAARLWDRSAALVGLTSGG